MFARKVSLLGAAVGVGVLAAIGALALLVPQIYLDKSVDGWCPIGDRSLLPRILALPVASSILAFVLVALSPRPHRRKWRYVLGSLVAVAAFLWTIALMNTTPLGYCQS